MNKIADKLTGMTIVPLDKLSQSVSEQGPTHSKIYIVSYKPDCLTYFYLV